MAANPFNDLEQKLDNLTHMVSELSKQLYHLQPQTNDKPLDVKGAAEYLGTSTYAIYNLTFKRAIPHFKQGKRLYFNKEELSKWVQSNRKLTVEEIEAQA